jgi:hypothetical protein
MDPTPGYGITDAVRDAAVLAEAIIDGSERALLLYWRRRDADSLGLYHFAADMGSEEYNNPVTRMLFKRTQNSPAMMKRMHKVMDREIRPQAVLKPLTALRWILAETLAGNFALWAALGRTMRFGQLIQRQQAVLDRALKRAERGDLDYSAPSLLG